MIDRYFKKRSQKFFKETPMKEYLRPLIPDKLKIQRFQNCKIIFRRKIRISPV
jgi:hypothetical protein